MNRRSVVLAATVVLMAGSPVLGQRPTIDDITSRAAAYVAMFFTRFSNVVAEEQYRQDVMSALPSSAISVGRRGGGAPGGTQSSSIVHHRELTSDFLFVTLAQSGELMPFRDTFEVDGSAVRDRQQRLATLFLTTPSPTAVDEARVIAEESAKYNIGNLQRTVNNPVLALAWLLAVNQPHLEFTLEKADPAGSTVWVVSYQERLKPTFVQGASDRDLPAHGRFWIDVATGRVTKTELVVQDPNVTARITTSFHMDDQFKVDVPLEMREEYTLATAQISGRATYGRFRQFGVTTDEHVTDQDQGPKH